MIRVRVFKFSSEVGMWEFEVVCGEEDVFKGMRVFSFFEVILGNC